MNRCIAVVLCALAGAFFVGCGSKDKQTYKINGRVITLRTEPAGARVTQVVAPMGDAVKLGMTPLVNQPVMVMTSMKGTFSTPQAGQLMSRMNVAHVRIEKDGYQPYEGNLATDPKRVTEHVITLEPVTPATRPTASAAP